LPAHERLYASAADRQRRLQAERDRIKREEAKAREHPATGCFQHEQSKRKQTGTTETAKSRSPSADVTASKGIATVKSDPVGASERLYTSGLRLRQRLDSAQRQAIEKKQADALIGCTFSPEITELAKSMNRHEGWQQSLEKDRRHDLYTQVSN
jgi:hypothetical protein